MFPVSPTNKFSVLRLGYKECVNVCKTLLFSHSLFVLVRVTKPRLCNLQRNYNASIDNT